MQLYLLYLQIIPTFVPIKSNPIINKTSTAVMKKKTILFASCLLGVFAFSSCEKNLYDESKQPEKEKKMTDLEVPADFDWKGSQNAKVKIEPWLYNLPKTGFSFDFSTLFNNRKKLNKQLKEKHDEIINSY